MSDARKTTKRILDIITENNEPLSLNYITTSLNDLYNNQTYSRQRVEVVLKTLVNNGAIDHIPFGPYEINEDARNLSEEYKHDTVKYNLALRNPYSLKQLIVMYLKDTDGMTKKQILRVHNKSYPFYGNILNFIYIMDILKSEGMVEFDESSSDTVYRINTSDEEVEKFLEYPNGRFTNKLKESFG